jgi:hypothetical protein
LPTSKFSVAGEANYASDMSSTRLSRRKKRVYRKQGVYQDGFLVSHGVRNNEWLRRIGRVIECDLQREGIKTTQADKRTLAGVPRCSSQPAGAQQTSESAVAAPAGEVSDILTEHEEGR